MQSETAGEEGLLTPEDPAPYITFNTNGAEPLLLLCDHASNAVPRRLAGLGLLERDLNRHIAHDIGAAGITRHLAKRFDAPAILAGYSRLVIDCNRTLDHETSIIPESDATVIPGNARLGDGERRARAAACFWPYHRQIARTLESFDRRGVVPALIAVHSFTPVLLGNRRPWQIGVLWNEDDRIAAPLIEALRARTDYEIGDNEPYSGKTHTGFTMAEHAIAAGRPCVMLEIREDLVPDAESEERVGELLALCLADILGETTLYTRWSR